MGQADALTPGAALVASVQAAAQRERHPAPRVKPPPLSRDAIPT